MRNDYTYVRAVHGLVHSTPAYRQPILVNSKDQQVELSTYLGKYEVIDKNPIDLTRGFSTEVPIDPLMFLPVYRADTDVLVVNLEEHRHITKRYPKTKPHFFYMAPSAGTNNKPILGIQATIEEHELWVEPLRETAQKVLNINVHGWLCGVTDGEQVVNEAFQLQRAAFWNEDLLYYSAAAIRLVDDKTANQLLAAYRLKDEDKYHYARVKLLQNAMKI